ncbi:MAG: helix-turn-helix transcriptional regulator [Parabacteroides sp.]|nr:helix-turn-helix transcriptional regulator [Parabacteroides sp.]
MPRAIVTSELADVLRSIRIQNKIQSKALASHIGKSPAYISKLESGNIQTIDNGELYSILQFISCSENNPTELAEQVYASLKFKYSKKEIEEQLWFANYDTVDRYIPIPESLIDEIKHRIEDCRITHQQLLDRINANEALSKEEISDDSIIYNQWYHQSRLGGSAQSIKIKMTESQLDSILNKDTDVSPYVFVFCILFYVLKIGKYNAQIQISDDENKELMAKTTSLLNQHKFFSIIEKDALMSEKQSKNEIVDLLSTFDKDNIEIINDIISGFRFASEYNIKTTNEQLKKFSKNMHWDLGFMLKIISMDFRSLEKTSVSNKRNLIAAIQQLLNEYVLLPDDQNKIETY